MNTQAKWATTVQVVDEGRREFWMDIFGTDTLPVVGVVPQWATVPSREGPQLVYMLDLRAIDGEQRARLVGALAEKFRLPVGEVAGLLDVHGVPVLADDVVLTSSDVGQIVSLLDDDDELGDWWCEVEWEREGDDDDVEGGV